MTNLNRYLVAGGAGFIGSHLVETLLEVDGHVTVLDNFTSGSERNLSHVMGNPALNVIHADITDHLPELGPFDVIFHLAAVANPYDYENLPLEVLRVNSNGNENLLGLATDSGARYVFFSSSEVYGHHEPMPAEGLDERSMSKLVLNQRRSPYFVGKIFGEDLAGALAERRGLDCMIVRPFNIYGPRMDINTPFGRVIPNFINWALDGKRLIVHGSGNQERAFCYVDDLVRCLLLLLNENIWRYPVLNIGFPESITITDLAGKVQRIVGVDSGIEHVERYMYEPRFRRPNIDRAIDWLGWEPEVGLDEGLCRTVEFFRGVK